MRRFHIAFCAALVAGLSTFAVAEDDTLVLDNGYATVHRNAAPCAGGGTGCGDRIIVAFGDLSVVPSGGSPVQLGYADVFVAGGGRVLRNPRPRVRRGQPEGRPSGGRGAGGGHSPRARTNCSTTATNYFVFEERLEPGDTRERHSHAQRVVLVMGATELQQWPDGVDEVFKTQVPGTIKFNPPVVHVVKNIGDAPLRNIVIELIPR